MRILMLNWRDPQNPRAGGAERVTLGYLAELARRKHEVYWFAPSFPGASPQEIISGVHIVRGGRTGTCIIQAIRWYRRQKRFDLVIDQHHGIPWYAPWWCKTNCLAYIHEVLGPIWDAFYPWPLSTLGRWQERCTHWVYRNVPFWTACSSTKKMLAACRVRDVTLIPYGVQTEPISLLDEKPLIFPLRLVVVSRLASNKRVDHAIQAIRCLRDQNIEAHLTIIGTGSVQEELRRLASKLGLGHLVSFTGWLLEKEKDDYLRASHFLLHTSIREGWGLNVIEANALGTPALVYPVPGLTESTLDCQTGLVSKEETPQSLAAALMKFLATPEAYQSLRRQAWERAKTFHWEKVLPRACDWLEEQSRIPRR